MAKTLIITATGGRPKALATLSKWLAAQTTEDFSWLVVSDDSAEYKKPKGAIFLRRDVSPDETLPSLNLNLLHALDWIDSKPEYDKFVFCEDDDWYSPSYVRETQKLLDRADLVGWNEDLYYYVMQRKFRRCHNQDYASLAATGFTRAVLPYMRSVCLVGDIFIDNILWHGIRRQVFLPQAPLKLADGSTVEGPPQAVSQVVSSWTGSRILVDNFSGLAYGGREVVKLDKTGMPLENPRHIGCKGDWHGGVRGLSVRGHDHTLGGAQDIYGKLLTKWVGAEAAAFFMGFTKDPDSPKRTGRPYPENVLIPLESSLDD